MIIGTLFTKEAKELSHMFVQSMAKKPKSQTIIVPGLVVQIVVGKEEPKDDLSAINSKLKL